MDAGCEYRVGLKENDTWDQVKAGLYACWIMIANGVELREIGEGAPMCGINEVDRRSYVGYWGRWGELLRVCCEV